jgi:hypothetical protein
MGLLRLPSNYSTPGKLSSEHTVRLCRNSERDSSNSHLLLRRHRERGDPIARKSTSRAFGPLASSSQTSCEQRWVSDSNYDSTSSVPSRRFAGRQEASGMPTASILDLSPHCQFVPLRTDCHTVDRPSNRPNQSARVPRTTHEHTSRANCKQRSRESSSRRYRP